MPKPNYVIEFNGERLQVDQSELSGAQIRALFGVEPSWNLVLEAKGAEPDILVSDDQIVSLEHRPVRIFSMPPAMFGGSVS